MAGSICFPVGAALGAGVLTLAVSVVTCTGRGAGCDIGRAAARMMHTAAAAAAMITIHSLFFPPGRFFFAGEACALRLCRPPVLL